LFQIYCLLIKNPFFTDFSFTISAGASNRYSQQKTNFARTNGGLTIPTAYNLKNSVNPLSTGGDNPDVGNTLYESQVTSVFGYADIGYKNMVYLKVTGRNDWTTTLQKPYNSFFYPSASLSVIGSEIVKLPTFISYFKLRGSYANISSDVDPYYTIPCLYIRHKLERYTVCQPARNYYNTRHSSKNNNFTEYGTELKFLKNRIGIDFTYFSYLEKNFPKEVPISQASGYNSILVNADEIYRRGIEVILTGSPVRTKGCSLGYYFQLLTIAPHSKILLRRRFYSRWC
jgi:hypothetical protein